MQINRCVIPVIAAARSLSDHADLLKKGIIPPSHGAAYTVSPGCLKMPADSISRPFVASGQEHSRRQRLAERLYRRVRQLQTSEVVPGTVAAVGDDGGDDNRITLVCVSDTHNTKPSDIPPGDVLLHAGDLSQFGTFAEVQAQLIWLGSHPHPHKVIIAGNHNLLLDNAFVARHPDRELDRHPGQRLGDLDWGEIHYLESDCITLNISDKGRSIRIYGSPWTPRCGNWAFQYDPTKEKGGAKSDTVTGNVLPEGLDVALLHGPPMGHLDEGGKGCGLLLAEIWRKRPTVVVCGHIHGGRGQEFLMFDRAQAWYENVILQKRKWASILALAVYVCWLGVFRITGLGTSRRRHQQAGTHLVNASMVGGRGNRELKEAIVISI